MLYHTKPSPSHTLYIAHKSIRNQNNKMLKSQLYSNLSLLLVEKMEENMYYLVLLTDWYLSLLTYSDDS